MWRVVVSLAALLLVAVGCSDVSEIADQTGTPVEAVGLDPSETGTPETGTPEAGTPEAGTPEAGTTELGPSETSQEASGQRESGQGSDLAALITELPPAPIGAPEPEAPRASPTGLTIESLGVETAAVIGVGIEANGDMEVPPADQVGWYRYGPSPGQEGSSVLAAHIAFDGQDGVFVSLDQIELGSTIEVSYDDGTTQRFEATGIEQYDKNELPRESVFGRSGESQLVLITCGGDFNRNLRSYEDNVVVYASPVA